MNSHRPDLNKHPWPISPTFRTGPRQVGYDQNAEEIIRFVRHYQRPEMQQHRAPCVKRKAVLPAIGRFYSCVDETSPTNNVRQRQGSVHGNSPTDNIHQGSVESELQEYVAENQSVHSTLENVGSNDIQNVEIGCHATGSVYESNNNSFEGTYINKTVELLETHALQETVENRYISNSQEILQDIEENKSLIRDDQLLSYRSSNAYTGMTKFSNNTTPAANFDFSKPVSMKYCSKSTSNMGQLRQLQALPQLPPIATCRLTLRPSAPSPPPISPIPMSSSDIDDSSDDDRYEDKI